MFPTKTIFTYCHRSQVCDIPHYGWETALDGFGDGNKALNVFVSKD